MLIEWHLFCCGRIVGFATHPVNSLFATSAVGRLRGNTPAVDHHSPRVGRVSIWDLKTMKLEVSHLMLKQLLLFGR